MVFPVRLIVIGITLKESKAVRLPSGNSTVGPTIALGVFEAKVSVPGLVVYTPTVTMEPFRSAACKHSLANKLTLASVA